MAGRNRGSMSVTPTIKPFSTIREPNLEYLARALPEQALDPELPIIDNHHHLLIIRGRKAEKFGKQSQYLVDEFAADIAESGHNVIASVFIECDQMYRATGPKEMRPVGEVEFLVGQAAMADSGDFGPARIAAGIVGQADLNLGDAVAPVLEAEIAAGNGRFCGVRHSGGFADDPSIRNNATARPGLYLDETFRRGVKKLGEFGLTFDAMVFHPQLPDVTSLAKALPEVTIALGHCGAPLGSGKYAEDKEGVFATWKESMTELSKCPNVHVKLGGMTIRLAAYDFRVLNQPPTSTELAGLWGRYISTCIELFGPERCMFESNFPVEKMGVPYGTLWNAFKRISSGASDSEKHSLFSDTARRVYRLNV